MTTLNLSGNGIDKNGDASSHTAETALYDDNKSTESSTVGSNCSRLVFIRVNYVNY